MVYVLCSIINFKFHLPVPHTQIDQHQIRFRLKIQRLTRTDNTFPKSKSHRTLQVVSIRRFRVPVQSLCPNRHASMLLVASASAPGRVVLQKHRAERGLRPVLLEKGPTPPPKEDTKTRQGPKKGDTRLEGAQPGVMKYAMNLCTVQASKQASKQASVSHPASKAHHVHTPLHAFLVCTETVAKFHLAVDCPTKSVAIVAKT